MFGSNGVGRNMPEPSIANNPDGKPYYFLVLILAVCAAVSTIWLNRSRLGRLLRGGAESSTALETRGTSVTVTRVLVFCISAFMAAIGGALAGPARRCIRQLPADPLTHLLHRGDRRRRRRAMERGAGFGSAVLDPIVCSWPA